MNLPTHSGYVVAAYIVLVLLLLIYLSIMATKLSRVERETGELLELANREGRLEPGAEAETDADAETVSDRAGAS